MAIKKYVAISYCFIFIAIYLSSIAYALLSSSVNKIYDLNLPQTAAMNATSSAINSLSPGGEILITIGIVVLLLTIISIVMGCRAMQTAV